MIQNRRVYIEGKDYKCLCGCGESIILTSRHRRLSEGVPIYIAGHNGTGKTLAEIVGTEEKANAIKEKRRLKVIGTKRKSKYPDVDLHKVVYCACKCGSRIKILSQHKYVGIPEYISGHNATTVEGRKLAGLANIGNTYSVGCKRTEEANEKNRITHLGNTNAKGKRSEKAKQNIRNGLKNRSYTKKFAGGRNNLLELKLQKGLTKHNIEFITHKGIRLSEQLTFPDMIINNICIFVDGDYWHAWPGKYNADFMVRDKTAQEIWDYDNTITKELAIIGHIVLRFWEHEINSNLEDCIKTIKDKLYDNYKK